jgi:hypothetical protein
MQPPLKRLSTGTGQQEGQRMQDVDENFGRLETEVDLLNANASLLSGIVLTNDLDGFAATVNHAEIKFFMTEGVYTFGAGKTFRAVGFASTRWVMKFMVAFASNNKIYMRYKPNDSSPWTDWVEH